MYISPKQLLTAVREIRKCMNEQFVLLDDDGLLSELEYGAMCQFAEDHINKWLPTFLKKSAKNIGTFYITPIVKRSTIPLQVQFKLVYFSSSTVYEKTFDFNLIKHERKLK